MSRSCIHWCAGITAMVMLALPAMGTIDKDADEMSDIWEGEYGFSTTGSATSDEDPGADPDGDGWTNLQESMAGTDPGSAEMPEGVLKTQIAQNPSLTGVFAVSWETTPGKYYTLWVSTELDIWTPVGTAMLGDGTPIEIAVSSSGSKLFWRTTAADQDSDGDGMSDFEEWLVGTDSHKTDTDGDGVSDAGEVEQGKSPTDPNDTPTADWFTLVGDKPMDVVKSETRLFTVKKGETKVFVLGTQSDEYPVYTGGPSIFNDTLEWQITPGSETAITGSINVNDRDLDWALDGANNVTLNGLEPVHVETVKVIQAPVTSDLVVTVTLKGTNISDGTLPSRLVVGILSVKIVPDENMTSVIGDMVTSNKGVGGERHFVTPQKTAALNQQYLKLRVLGLEPEWITAGDPNQLVEWATGVGMVADSDVLKWKVDRVSAGHITAKIRTIEKYSSEEAAKLNAWVTWATPLADTNPSSLVTPEMRNPSDTFTPSGTPILLQRGQLNIKFLCEPHDMFDLTGDVPTLYTTKTVDPPGGNHPWLGTPLKDGARIKYDVSRRLRVATISSDTDVLNASLAAGPNVLAYPSDPLEGNDDPDVSGEKPPYTNEGIGTTAIMKDSDQPHHQIAHSLGADNATFVELAQFQEFARVEIGGKWYNCSDDFLSEITFKGKKVSGKWQDNGSQFVTGNNSTFPPQ